MSVDSPINLAAALAGSAAASAAVPEGDGDPAGLAWRWVVGTEALDLYAAQPTSPDWRATCLGAGGALHRARVALHAEGLATNAVLLPSSGSERKGTAAEELGHLAHLVATGSVEVTPEALALYDATEPSPVVAAQRAPAGRGRGPGRLVVRELVAAARAEGVRLRLVRDGGALAGVLHGADTREAWLRAGAALSAVRLTSRRHGLEAVTSMPERGSRRRMGDREGWLGVGIGTPYVRLRLTPSA